METHLPFLSIHLGLTKSHIPERDEHELVHRLSGQTATHTACSLLTSTQIETTDKEAAIPARQKRLKAI